ncbi:MAG: hypothetical protein IPM01_30950 [Burkholderiaceae bacterium]|nr:hypothetical protein [Burkholderiaceae bacterium]
MQQQVAGHHVVAEFVDVAHDLAQGARRHPFSHGLPLAAPLKTGLTTVNSPPAANAHRLEEGMDEIAVAEHRR